MPDAINPLSPRQKFRPADSVRLWVDTYQTDKWNRIPNPDGSQGAWGWTVEEPNRAVISNTTGSVTYGELATLPLRARTSIPSEVSEYEILSATTVRLVVTRDAGIMEIPEGYDRGTGPSEYFVNLFRAPADLFSSPNSLGAGQSTYAVVQTPVGPGGSWVLESTNGPLPGAPGGPVATPAAMYVLTAGAYLSVDFSQVAAAETDVRVTVRSERFSVIAGSNLRSYAEIWDGVWRYDTGAVYATATKQTWFNFYRADGSYLSQLVQSASVVDGFVDSISYLVTAPADAVSATLNIRFIVPADLPNTNFRATFGNVMVLAGSDFVIPPEPPTVVDIFESATLLETHRGDLDAGTATLTTSDPALDVLNGSLTIPRGARAVLIAYINNTVHPSNAEILGTFTVMDSRTSYPMRGRKPTPLTVVDLQDAMHKLAAAPRPDGYYDIVRLPEVLEGAGVPWDVGNRSHSYGTDPADTHSDSATALDQIALTRDTHPGTHAYVDRFGVINVHQDGAEGTLDDRTREFYFDETDFNADAVPSVSSQDVINTVMITVQGAIPEQDSESVYNSATFGPYVDQASVDEFGARKSEIEITVPYEDARSGLITTEYLRPIADSILSRNSRPYLKFEELTFGVSGDHINGRNITIPEATIDVADMVYLTSPSAGMTDAPYRARTVAHVITPRTWVMTLGFAGESTLSTPATQPALRSTGVAAERGSVTTYMTVAQSIGTGGWGTVGGFSTVQPAASDAPSLSNLGCSYGVGIVSINTAGFFTIGLRLRSAQSAGGLFAARLLVNGVSAKEIVNPAWDANCTVEVELTRHFSQGDQITMQCYNNTGATRSFSIGSTGTSFSVTRL